MPSVYSSPFIYTNFFTASHIIVTNEEPAITLPGLYVDLLTGKAQDITVQCTFAELNDILHCEGEGLDELTEQLADQIVMEAAIPLTIDVTESGGLACRRMYYCLERAMPEDEEEQDEPGIPDYCLRGMIKQNQLETLPVAIPQDKQELVYYHLALLSIRYRFYLHFLEKKETPELAQHYAGLNQPIIFELSKNFCELNTANRL